MPAGGRQKRRHGGFLSSVSLAALIGLGLAGPAAAQTDRNWDVNGTAVNSGGTGTWDTSTPNWSPNSDGVSGPYAPWVNASIDNAIFGGTAGTVTLSTPIVAHNLTFNTSGYILSGNTLTLAGTAPTITTTSGAATISSILAGNAGLTTAGAGTLNLTGANSFSGGVNVTAGTLNVSGDSSLGDASNGIALSSGATLRSTGALAAGRVVTLLSGSSAIGGGVGSAHITGSGGFGLAAQTTLSDDTNDFTGAVGTDSANLYFTSIRNLGQASALGAPTTAANGAVFVRSAAAIYTGSGDTSNRSWNMAPSGGSSALINQGSGTLTVTGDITAGGGFTSSVVLNAQNADLALSGVISSNLATRPFTFNGGGTNRSITLTGANTFGGAVTIQTVTVSAKSLANQGTASSLGTGAGVGTISVNSGALSYVGTASSTNRGLSINGSSSVLNDGTGALTLSGAVAFNAAAPADTLTLGGSFAGSNTLSGVISGAGNVAMNGTAGSLWLLSGANTYSGTTTVTSGTLQAGNDQAFGTPNAVIVNGGTLDLNTHDITITSLAGTGGSVALNGADLTVNGATATSYSGSITGTGGLVKQGNGTLTLAGQSSYTGATTINGSSLTLNFAAAGAPASNIISSASTLNMAGGTLTLSGAAGVANSQTFNGLNVTAGNNRIAATSGAGGSMTLNLGALTRSSGLMDFTLPGSGVITTTNIDGALAWATVNGTDYAQILAGNITAFTAYANKDDAGTWLTGDIVSDAGGAANTPFTNSVAGNVQLGGIKYTAAANSTVTVGSGNTLGVDGTIIVAASVGNASQTITGGSLTGSGGGGTLGILHNGTGTGTFTIASTIVDNGGATSFVKGGSGRVSLTGANSYTGGTTLSGGTLAVSSIANGGVASSIGASTADPSNLVIESGTLEYTGATAATDRGFTLVNGGPSRTIQITDGNANLTFSGVVSGPDDAGFIKTGAGTLTLANAANTYTGVTTVSGGTLSVNTLANGGVASGIGAATADPANLVLQNAGGLQYTGGTVASDRGLTLGTGNGRIGVSNAATTLTLSSAAIGSGGLIKEGTGTLLLSGTNLYAGGTTITAGTLRAGSAQAFGSQTALLTVNAGATLDLAGFANKVGALAGGGAVTLGSATLTSGGVNGTFTGAISGSGGFFQSAGGTQTIVGCNNNYTGATTVSGGTLSVNCIANGGVASGIGASSGASANLVLTNGNLIYTGTSTSTNRGFTLGGTGTLTVSDPTATLQFSGAVVGTGALQKAGAGTLVLSGVNTYTGGTSITAGILRAGSTSAFGTGGFTLANTAGATLDLAGFNNTVGYLNGGGALGGNITLGSATLTLNWPSGIANYAGAISGSGGLVKNGGVTQILSGCGSSYTGSTTINGGAIEVACLANGGSNSAIGASSASASNLALNGGTLRYTGAAGSTDRLFTLGASAASRLEASGTGAIAFIGTGPIGYTNSNTSQTLALGGTNTGNNSLAAQITNNGAGVTSLTKDGVGTWILKNPNSSYTGVTTINGGVLGVDKLANGGVASSIGASSAAASNLIIGNGSTLRYTGAGDTTNRLFTLSAGTTFVESSGTGAIVFTDTGPVTLASANLARTIALGGTNTGNNKLAGAIADAGTGVTTLAKNDAGTWVLTGNNSYTGPTNINAGILYVGGGGTTGSIASAIVNNAGMLGYNRSDAISYAGLIQGTGSVLQAGTGITTLTGADTYSGGTTISAGTLQLGNGGTTGSIVGNVTDNGTLTFNRSNAYQFDGVISGTGAVTQIGTGTTTLTADNSYTGGTTISAGTLQLGNGGTTGSVLGNIADNGALIFNRSNALTYAGVVSGTGTMTKSGAGTLTLTGNSTYTGGTTISAGTLQIGNGGTSGSIAGNVTDNGGLTFSRSDATSFAGLISGTGSVTQSGPGTLTLSGANSYSGATTVSAGTLLVNGSQAGATGATSVASGATLGGSGRIGGDVTLASGATLAPGSNGAGTLAINGNLSLGASSNLNFELGQAGTVGGALNDLVTIGGNLVLDGTLNVQQSAGGTFGPGLYRLFNYTGTLTDNGLVLGSSPSGSTLTVQTAVAGQVNLANSNGLALNFWDGTGPKTNSVVNGGSGTWQNSAGNNNWTDATGSVNAVFTDGAFAIFSATPGTVTVDNSLGQVSASGMQFASNGYVVTGNPVALTGATAIIRVGDGTTAGAPYVATINSILSGASALEKDDFGTLVLGGANSYTGGTILGGGTLSVASDANLGAASGALSFNGGVLRWTGGNFTNARPINWGTNGGGFDISNNASTYILPQALAGNGSLTKLGSGTLSLRGANSYTGGTTITAGTLQVGGGGTTGSILGDVVDNGTLVFNRSDATTFAGAITGTGTVSQIAAGTVTLTGNSNYGGATNISNGGGIRIASGAVVSSGGASPVIGGTLTVDGAGSVFNVPTITAQSAAGIAGVVNVQNGGVLRTSGNLVLRNAPSNIVLTTLNVSGAGSLADIGGAVTVGVSAAFNTAGVNISAGGKLKTAAASTMGAAAGNTTAPFITITGADSDWTSTNSLAITNGALSLLNGGTASFTSVTAGSVSGAFPAAIAISGTGSQLTTSGDLVIGSGVGTGSLTVANGGRASVGGSILLGNGATATGILNIGGAEGQAAAGIGTFDATALVFGGSGSRINFNHTDPAYSFATLLSGAGSVNQVAGTTILTANSSYSGTTTVSGGTLFINGDQSAATGLTSVAAGATLGGTGRIGGDVTVANGATLTPGGNGGPGTLTINGNLNLGASSGLGYEFGQSNTVGGPLNDLTKVGGNLVLDGTINVAETAGGNFDPGVYRVISYGGTLTNNGLTVGTIPAGSVVAVQTSAPGQVNLVNSAGTTLNFWDGAAGPKNDSIVNGGNGTWQASGGNDNWTDITGALNAGYSDGAFAIFSATPGTVSIDNSLGAVTASGMQFVTSGYTLNGDPLTLTGSQAVIRVGDGTADGTAYTARIDAVLTGASQLAKTDLGTLILTGANTYAGGTAIEAGTLQIGNGGTSGSILGDVADNGRLAFNRSDTTTFAGTISGTGTLSQSGSGTTILTATNSYAGGTTIDAGTLQIGNGGTNGSIVSAVTDNALLAFDRSDVITYAGTISGTGALSQAGSGTLILTGTNSYAGGTTIGAGTLQIGDGGISGSITGNVTDNGALAFNRSDDITFGGTISGSGAVTKAGTGTTILTDTNSYAGTTSVVAGTLLVNGDQSAATGATNVASGATLGGTGTIGGSVAVADGGVLTPGDNGAGTLHIGGNLTLAAASQLNVQFGQAGVAGGALNDLVDVAGNLTLDGTINVAITPAGSFGAGLYRIANYGGTLTDNGLSVGALPSGFDAAVQTSVVHQVNLIASAITPPGGGGGSGGLSFWDGAAGPKANNVINGGDGVWQNGTGNDNWTSSTGAVNARYADGTLAIFAAAAGTVTVDDSLGAVTAGGMQFASDGYRITGNALTLTGAQAAIRVGDGTAAGAGYTATVSAALSGSAQLAKTDLGTLILTGANTYTGGTQVQSGTLLINGDSSAATGATNVVSGATLGGTGTIGGNVSFANGAILTPGSKAPGTLTIKGDLALAAGTQLAYELGQANIIGGALNDLVNVGGNLVLDGTLNVSVPAGGAFDVGVYRLFNYGGALTDNGLTLGTLPTTGATVQTSVAGQVNLVNGAGLALNFWDGAAAPRGDGVVSGGSGTWQNHSGNDNWTNANGSINGAYADGAFAIFGGTGGTVTVDTSLGAVNSAGMQFAANGYTIDGGTLTLSGPQSIIRVGDGTAAGAQFSATIGATLGGTAQLVKTDLGTLILGGTNSYTGGTLINAGTLQISGDANLGAAAGGVTLDGGTLATSADLTSARNVALTSGSVISTASGTTFTFSGGLSGSGTLTKAGAGTLRLTGDDSAYAGATIVSGGTLDVRGTIGGTMAIATGARLEGTGRVGSVTNAGTIAPGGADLGTLTVAGYYAGNGGTLEITTQLGGDASPTDRLVVTGGTSGTTQVTVANRGGLGAQTAEGIKIVDVAGASDGVFALHGDYVFQGDQAVIAGAYGYRLYKGGVSTPADGDWYLRSTLLNPVSPPQTPDTPLYQPGVPIYEVYPSTLLLLNNVGTMQQRTGDRGYSAADDGRPNGIWGRMEGQRFRPNAASSTSQADADYNSWSAEIGADHVLAQTARGATLTGSISARYGKASAQVHSLFGNGDIKTHGYGARATLTWQDEAGFYADAQAQFSWYDSDLNSSVLGKLAHGNDGTGQTYSLELGKRVALGGIAITPQLQTVYSKVRFDAFTDPAGADVSLGKADSLKSRWGIAIEHRGGAARLYAVGNLTYDWLGDTVTDVSGTPIARSDYRLWSEVSVGGSVGVNDRLTLYGEATGNSAIRDFGKSYGLKGVVGVRMRF